MTRSAVRQRRASSTSTDTFPCYLVSNSPDKSNAAEKKGEAKGERPEKIPNPITLTAVVQGRRSQVNKDAHLRLVSVVHRMRYLARVQKASASSTSSDVHDGQHEDDREDK